MLGNMFGKNMMGKMSEMKEQVEKVKAKLETISVIGKSDNGNVEVIANGNRMIEKISLNESFAKTASKEEIEHNIKEAANRALEQAERVEQSEMSHSAMGIMSGLK